MPIRDASIQALIIIIAYNANASQFNMLVIFENPFAQKKKCCFRQQICNDL